jgi:hypothetical protein
MFVPAEEVDAEFIGQACAMLRTLGAEKPARKCQSFSECRFCPVTEADCPERLMAHDVGKAETDEF